MSWKTLLVHLDDSANSSARLDFALDLARRFDAHLIGLYVVCQDLLQLLVKSGESGRLADFEARHAANLQRAHAHFMAAGERAGLAVEWRAPPGPAIEAAILHARHADLLIAGQRDPQDSASFIARNFLEDLLMGSGRPVVLLPYAGQIRSFGENVLIAWDSSREAARAVADALPLLGHARFVTVVTVQRHPDAGPAAGIDVANWLERHGIHAGFVSAQSMPGVNAGATVLNLLSDRHADLLVMGAYGHARAYERVLGGLTQALLETMTVPVLMSH